MIHPVSLAQNLNIIETNPELPFGLFDKQADWGNEASPPQKGKYKIPGSKDRTIINGKEIVYLKGNGDGVGENSYRLYGEFSTSDEGFYLYKELKGDWSIEAKVEWKEDINRGLWGKAGVMIRDAAQLAHSTFFMMAFRVGWHNKIHFRTEWRDQLGEITNNRGSFEGGISAKNQAFFRVSRIAAKNLFFSEWSPSGQEWTFDQYFMIPMNSSPAYGLFITNGVDDTNLNEVQFSDVELSKPVPFAIRSIQEKSASELIVSIEVINSNIHPVEIKISEMYPKGTTLTHVSHDGEVFSNNKEHHSIMWNQTFEHGSTFLSYSLKSNKNTNAIFNFEGTINHLPIIGARHTELSSQPLIENSEEADNLPTVLERILDIPDDVGQIIPAKSRIVSSSDMPIVRYSGKRFFAYTNKTGSWSMSGEIKIPGLNEFDYNMEVGGMVWNEGTKQNQQRYGIRFFYNLNDFVKIIRLNFALPGIYEEINLDRVPLYKDFIHNTEPLQYDTLHFKVNRISEENFFFGEWSWDGKKWFDTTPRYIPMQKNAAYGLYIRSFEESNQPAFADVTNFELKPFTSPYCIRSFHSDTFQFHQPVHVNVIIHNPSMDISNIWLHETIPDHCEVIHISNHGKIMGNQIHWHMKNVANQTNISYTLLPVFKQNGALEFKGVLNSIPVMGKNMLYPEWQETEQSIPNVWRTWTRNEGLLGKSKTTLDWINDQLIIQYDNDDSTFILDGYTINSSTHPISYNDRIFYPTTPIQSRKWISAQQFVIGEELGYEDFAYDISNWTSNLIDPLLNGLFESVDEQFRFFQYTSSQAAFHCDFRRMFYGYDDNIWITGYGGVFQAFLTDYKTKMHPDSVQSYPVNPDYFYHQIEVLFEKPGNNLVSTSLQVDQHKSYEKYRILTELKDGKWKLIYKPDESQQIITGFTNMDEEIIALQESDAREKSIIKANQHYRVKYPLPSNINGPFEILQVGELDSFYIATTDGIARFSPQLWDTPLEVAHIDEMILSIQEDSLGRIWFLSPTRLIGLEEKRWREYPFPAPFLFDADSKHLMTILKDQTVVLDTKDETSLITFNTNSSIFSKVNHNLGKPIDVLGTTSEGNLWIGRSDGKGGLVLEQFNGKEFLLMYSSQFVLRDSVLDFMELDTNRFFVSYPSNIISGFFFPRDFLKQYSYQMKDVNCCNFQSSNEIWVADDTQIKRIIGNEVETVYSHDAPINSIVHTNSDSLLVASNNGLLSRQMNIWMNWLEEDGLRNNHIRSVWIDRKGRWWAGTMDGISLYNPDADSSPPSTLIDIQKNSHQIAPNEKANFVFSGMDKWKQTTEERLLFSYKLDSNPWSEFTEYPTVMFPNLPGGNYVLQVRTMDRNWNMDSTPVVHSFTVLSPWYLQTSSLIAYVLIGFSLVGYIYFHYYNYFKLERLVFERTKALSQKNTELTNEKNARLLVEKEIHFISEREQIRIGQDIHDGVIQQLSGVKMMSESILNRYSIDNPDINQLNSLLIQSIEQLRGLSKGLYPVDLHQNGLYVALQEMANTVEEMYKIPCTINADVPEIHCDEMTAINVFRIVQECVNNAIKYSKAKRIKINMQKLDEANQVTVEDDGIGFDPEIPKSDASDGMGMSIMNYRADIINAKLIINSTMGKGTIIQCLF